MEKKEKIYQSASVYSIKSPNTDKIYIGSTHNKLSKRMKEHLYEFKTQDKYYTSFEIIQEGDAYIEEISRFYNISKLSLLKEEGERMKITPNCVNKAINGRTIQEWRAENKEKIQQYKKDYAKKNKENIKARLDVYTAENKEKIREYQKEYRKKNHEELADKKVKYRMENAEKLKESKTKIVACECGGNFQHNNKARHLTSKLHQRYVENLMRA